MLDDKVTIMICLNVLQYGRCSQVYAHNCDLKRHLVEDHLLGGSTVHTCLWHSCCTYFTVDDDGNVCLDVGLFNVKTIIIKFLYMFSL